MSASCVREFLLIDIEDENTIIFLEEVSSESTADTAGTSADDYCFGHFVRVLMLATRGLLVTHLVIKMSPMRT